MLKMLELNRFNLFPCFLLIYRNRLNWTGKEDSDSSVINGGVKPNSVLLDLDLKAKIGDFSWQRLETDDEVDRESQVVVVEEEDKGEIEKEES